MGRTLRNQVSALDLMVPRRERNGHLYREQKLENSRRATLFLYIKSDDDTYAVHETLFDASEERNASQWASWFNEHVYSGTGDSDDDATTRSGILNGAILPGINIKSGKLWDIENVMGFIQHDLRESVYARLDQARDKTKPQGKSARQTDIRRRHRNRKRETE